MKQIMIENIAAKDIIPLFSGEEVCERSHKFGPYARNHYLIHFCLRGAGELYDKFGTHKIKAGEMFIIRPGEITTYVADAENPWEYSWIAFLGDMADVFDTDRSVYSLPMEIGMEIRRLSHEEVTSPTVFISLIYKLIYSLFNDKKEVKNTVEKIKQYIVVIKVFGQKKNIIT